MPEGGATEAGRDVCSESGVLTRARDYIRLAPMRRLAVAFVVLLLLPACGSSRKPCNEPVKTIGR